MGTKPSLRTGSVSEEDRTWKRFEEAVLARNLPLALQAADDVDWERAVRDLQEFEKDRPRRSVFRPLMSLSTKPLQPGIRAQDARRLAPELLDGLVQRGWNPLEDRAIYEAIETSPGIVKVLARLCNPVGMRTSAEETLLHLVAQAGIGFPPKAQWFREALSVPTDVNAQTLRGHTAFHLLWSNGAVEQTRREDLAEWNRVNRTLLMAGLNVDLRAQNGKTGRDVFQEALTMRGPLEEMAPLLLASFEKSYQQARAHRLDVELPDPSPGRRGPRF